MVVPTPVISRRRDADRERRRGRPQWAEYEHFGRVLARRRVAARHGGSGGGGDDLQNPQVRFAF